MDVDLRCCFGRGREYANEACLEDGGGGSMIVTDLDLGLAMERKD